MSIWGKLIGGAAGFALGGPLGALLGAIAGHVYDSSKKITDETDDPTKQIGFTIAVIALGAKLAKADGVVSEKEIRAFRQVFKVAPEETNNVARVFNLARRSVHGYEPYAKQVAGMFATNPYVLEKLLGCLFFIAKADGNVSDAEINYLQNVSIIFGFSEKDFSRIRAENIGPDSLDPYTILGIPYGIDNNEIKSAYRKLIREHHPDTLIAQGMPEEFIEIANSKVAAINAAYDKVCNDRGIK
jgi:DnaJ like chaperone protein|tara:strand:+ start:231 stop:959 length:729 start_codon:yes stop_codon:yes gene_type:complete